MHSIKDLQEGYRAFRAGRWPVERETYRQLGEGQDPDIMVIACADSRVDPATIFSAGPGQLFVVRNVANLVPPYEPDTNHHGTSAAIEFAVLHLKVKHIVVMGHGGCGGVRACLSMKQEPVGDFIDRWVALAAPARESVLKEMPGAAPEALADALEHRAIRYSMHNLASFPFVQKGLVDGTLDVHGAWFAIKPGELHWMDKETGRFAPVQPQPPSA